MKLNTWPYTNTTQARICGCPATKCLTAPGASVTRLLTILLVVLAVVNCSLQAESSTNVTKYAPDRGECAQQHPPRHRQQRPRQATGAPVVHLHSCGVGRVCRMWASSRKKCAQKRAHTSTSTANASGNDLEISQQVSETSY